MENYIYPLLLEPVLKDYLWGGNRLIKDFGFKSDTDSVAEAWVLTSHSNGCNKVKNGYYKGVSLNEVFDFWRDDTTQSYYLSEQVFPILIKLIDARDKLSVQVHPNDEYSLINEGEPGKTEVWYVLDCAENASLVYGFNKKIKKHEFKERIENNTLNEVLNYVPVKKGDVFLIESGTIHAIGAGILIAEIQQNSNTTYRISDYGRTGADGKPRELHIDKALEVTNFDVNKKHCNFKTECLPFGSIKKLAECEYFTTELLNISGEFEFKTDKSFLSFLIIDGNIEMFYKNEMIFANKGDSILVPAKFAVKIKGNAQIILSKINYDKK